MSQMILQADSTTDLSVERFLNVRRFTEELASPLSAEDCAIQSMPDASPTKWHLAHTTWFFETFVLAEQADYRAFDNSYAYLFNSYYNALGKQFPRSQRGLVSRPGLAEILDYRRHVDDRVTRLLASGDETRGLFAAIIELGLQHEQQHQELMLTDIKHLLSCNPRRPIYRAGNFPASNGAANPVWREFDEGIYHIGHQGDGFCFDNESPRHRVFVESFQLCDRPITCGEYLRFMDDGGYERPELWLSLGWQQVCEQGWTAPLYWYQDGNDRWQESTLAGTQEVDSHLPVCHVSYFEADAFARWSGGRLATEAEWEVAAGEVPIIGNFVDTCRQSDAAIHPGCGGQTGANMFGDVWQWTASNYASYPRFTPVRGALGEYNAKFMCNQYVLRGGSCATHSTHIRRTYRNFFPPQARWQFTGIRLCR